MNCPKCGLMNTGNMAVGLAMPQCMCQWQSTQEKSRIETVPAQGGLLPTMQEGKDFTITHPPQRTEQEPIANLEIVDLGDGNKHFDNHWLSDLYSLPCGDYLLYTHQPQRTEPPAWFPAVENILNEYGLQAIDFVADFKAAMKDAEQPQRTWVGLTDEEAIEIGTQCQWYDGDCERFDSIGFARAIEAKLKEKNGFAEEKNT